MSSSSSSSSSSAAAAAAAMETPWPLTHTRAPDSAPQPNRGSPSPIQFSSLTLGIAQPNHSSTTSHPPTQLSSTNIL
ncbi:unnamed protein product [Spirodela intermedia]|uniref:Uncharacterized protein n=1 Tax=Spirodela intermedia TaxID=51605 RepID=A0A7I8J2B0_SPIIN|nr:unnamed protein product [Spirodela intermedia]CAA6664277.1 unnamed protein product [Spirodela intermedia]